MRSSWGGIADRMGESSSNRPDTGETSKMESPSTHCQLVDSLSKGWTDEKHTLFLNSIESSFVNELHNGEYNSKAFYGGISRTNTHRGSCGQYEKNETDLKSGQVVKFFIFIEPKSLSILYFLMFIFLIKHALLTLQFKVLYKESLVYNKGKKNAQLEIGSKTLSANPWIRHFRSPCVVTKRNSQFTQPSPHIASEGHYGEGTGIRRNCCHDFAANNAVLLVLILFLPNNEVLKLHLAEVSDQNFMDDGPISEKRSSIIGGKRKLRAAMIHDSINDQLVPSRKPLIMPISDGNHTLLSTNSECSSQTSEVIPNSLRSDAKELLHDDDEVNS
ncbi:hypothetical protein ZIOFF_044334 [Zingiber officinale]|uniref:Uncharacterized protein n=1 Tax=Zingiber officinale TaxID=94328 RepID=A0A8J5KX67_ZINOF|nr:hypothetical protein ZIOFF_044334 [Zingiber officinale]